MLISTGAAGGHRVLAELPRHRHAPADDRDHRARAHRLVDGGLDVAVGIVARAGHVAQPVVGGRVAQQALERPGERVRRRLVAGEHEREQLVAQLLVGQALAVLGLGLEQQREDVGALVAAGRAARRDHRVHVAVEVGQDGARRARPARRCRG